ncbi:hypothetical protein AYL44_13455 [Microbacterium oleivorans]|uniref:PIN domain-containing protein n=1 Tax=Microbacterium oleivorans TaxID=273677 RepID=A0A177K719_9MICO|nr:hypothetical protein AYL44_13455 [Microbacterium oleivorans]
MTFIDTSILCNLVPVPGFDQHRDEVVREMGERLNSGERFILPITAVVETGNHIAQLKSGHDRLTAAQKFDAVLRTVCAGQAPWILHDVAWDKAFLEQLLNGADTSTSYVEHAQARLGAGDLCILTERQAYSNRSRIRAGVWTLDEALSAHA